MLTINVCVGSACHLKGSYGVVKILQELINKESLQDKVEIKGSFCLGHCTKGVATIIENEDTVYSLNENNATAFFESEVRGRL